MERDLECPSELLGHYAALEAASHDMLRAARDADWDRVCRLEGACTVVIAQLRWLMAEREPGPRERAERMRILGTLLSNDAEIRRICELSSANCKPAGGNAPRDCVPHPAPWLH